MKQNPLWLELSQFLGLLIVLRSVFFPEFKLLNELGKRRQFLLLDQFKFIDEKDKMLKTGVQVILESQSQYDLKVGVINMRIDPEKPFEYRLDHGKEVFGERNAFDKRKCT